MDRFNVLVEHLRRGGKHGERGEPENFALFFHPPSFARDLTPEALHGLVEGLLRIPEGREWLRDHPAFVEAIRSFAEQQEQPMDNFPPPTSPNQTFKARIDWDTLLKSLEELPPRSR